MSNEIYQKRKEKLLHYYKEYKRLPTYEELAHIFCLQSKGSLHKYVQKFIDDGLVGKGSGGRLIPTTKLYGLRVLGTVQAGFPSPAEEELGDSISLDEYLIEKPDATFLLSVSGDSMIDAGIMPGDMVLIERGRDPKNGDIVIAQVDNEWTMKYYRRRGTTVFLEAANKKYKPIYPEGELNVAAVVKAVVRKY